MTPHPYIKEDLKDLSEAGLRANLKHFTIIKANLEDELNTVESRRFDLIGELEKRGLNP
jgi:hypothetical protein